MMKTYIQRVVNGRPEFWSGEEWINQNVDGWKSACAHEDHTSADFELEHLLEADDDGEFANASVVDIEFPE